MQTKHAFALTALILGIIGGVLLVKDGISVVSRSVERTGTIRTDDLLLLGLGVIAIIASIMVWNGQYTVAGLLNIILGITAIFYEGDTGGLMILLSGIFGFIAPKIKL
ncbi:MAG: hypothetical protein ACE5J6_00960 [Candidatus Bathyarchaeia archaeon]